MKVTKKQQQEIYRSSLSHDIRTPMNAIVGFTELAKKNLGNQELLEQYLDKVRFSARHVSDMISELLEVGEFNLSRFEIRQEKCNITEQIRSVMQMVRADADQKGVFFMFDLSIQDALVYADALNLRRILLTLVNNAITYTPEGGQVILKVEQKKDPRRKYAGYNFIVKDTGVGMSKEMVESLFTDEISNTSSHFEAAGGGYGLKIAKVIAEKMGGEITVKSRPKKGSTFTFFVPFQLVETKSSELVPTSGSRSWRKAQDKFHGKRILIVEDYALNREIAAEFLYHAGFSVEFAVDGQQAVKNVSSNKENYYDLILMDIQMPVMNGFEATRQIRAMDREDAKTIPIIALSANALKQDKEDALACGMNDHIAKPFDVDDFISTIEDNLEKVENC